MKKTKIFVLILIVLIIGFGLGRMIEIMKYHVTFAGCRESQLPDNQYTIIELDDSPLKKMFENYYAPHLDFVILYTNKNLDAETYIKSFGYGGFHYFKTSDGGVYQCGFYK